MLYVVSQYNIQPSVDDEAALGPLLLTGCSGILQLRYRTTWIEVEEAPGPGGGGALPADDGAAQRPAVAVPAPPAAMTFGRGEELG